MPLSHVREDEVSELALSHLFGSPMMALSDDAATQQRAAFERLYEDWFDHVAHSHLNDPIFHFRNPQWPQLFASQLGYPDALGGFGLVLALL